MTQHGALSVAKCRTIRNAFGNALGNSIVGQIKFNAEVDKLGKTGKDQYDWARTNGKTSQEALEQGQFADQQSLQRFIDNGFKEVPLFGASEPTAEARTGDNVVAANDQRRLPFETEAMNDASPWSADEIAEYKRQHPDPRDWAPGPDGHDLKMPSAAGTSPTRNYGQKIRTAGDLERAETNYLRRLGQNVLHGKGIDSRKIYANYEGGGYILGREYDVVSERNGFYTLTEVKYRTTKGNVDLNLKIPGIWDNLAELGWMAYQKAATFRQIFFDYNAGDNLVLTGRAIPGGSIVLDANDYQIVYVLGNQHGSGVAATTGIADRTRVNQIIDIVTGEKEMK